MFSAAEVQEMRAHPDIVPTGMTPSTQIILLCDTILELEAKYVTGTAMCTLLGPDEIESVGHEVHGMLASLLNGWAIVSLTGETGRQYTYISSTVPKATS